jgi:hypothetical protein
MDPSDINDTFVRDIRRVAQALAYGQDPGTNDYLLVKAAEIYLRHLDDPVDSEDASA